MPPWRLGVGFLLIVGASIVGLLTTLCPELVLVRSAPARRGAWIPSVFLQAVAGLALGISASIQQSAGLPPRDQIALGAFIVALTTWLFLSGLLSQFDRTARDGRRVFRACLALLFAFLFGMLLVGPRVSIRQGLSPRGVEASEVAPALLQPGVGETQQNNRMHLTSGASPAGAPAAGEAGLRPTAGRSVLLDAGGSTAVM